MRWLVALLDPEVEADTAKEAAEAVANQRQLEVDHIVYVVPADADGLETFRLGMEKIVVPTQLKA